MGIGLVLFIVSLNNLKFCVRLLLQNTLKGNEVEDIKMFVRIVKLTFLLLSIS